MRCEPKKWKLCAESPTSSWSPVCTFQKRFKRDSTGCSISHEMIRIETFMQFMQGLPRGRHFLISSPSPKDKTLRLLPPLLLQHYNCTRKIILWTHHAPVQLACKLINAPQDALFVGKEVVNLIFANWISIIIPPIARVGAYLCFKIRTLRLWLRLSLKKICSFLSFLVGLKINFCFFSTLQNIGKVSQNCAIQSIWLLPFQWRPEKRNQLPLSLSW